MTELDPDIFDDLFLGCAFAAYLEQASIQKDWPDMEATRRRACQFYEEELKRKHDVRAQNHGDDLTSPFPKKL